MNENCNEFKQEQNRLQSSRTLVGTVQWNHLQVILTLDGKAIQYYVHSSSLVNCKQLSSAVYSRLSRLLYNAIPSRSAFASFFSFFSFVLQVSPSFIRSFVSLQLSTVTVNLTFTVLCDIFSNVVCRPPWWTHVLWLAQSQWRQTKIEINDATAASASRGPTHD